MLMGVGVGGMKGLTVTGEEGTFQEEGDVLELDCGGGYKGACIC